MLSSIERHSPVDNAQHSADSELSRSTRESPRTHPRLTVYRILFFVLTAGLGGIKAVSSYQGYVTVPTTFDWVYGILVVSSPKDSPINFKVRQHAHGCLFSPKNIEKYHDLNIPVLALRGKALLSLRVIKALS
ncbi:hypothetical protein C8R45DRAFT_833205 [Mycena sanguinolenta]|nr:hypothetical protein C8R45DRAFT_833205 [Mycena sanguinolenta]